MILLSHPTGNEFVRAAARSLQAAGLLAEFHTTLAVFPDSLWGRLGSSGWRGEIRRRQFDRGLKPLTSAGGWREAGRLAATKLGIAWLTRHETGPLCLDAVYRSLDRRVAGRLPGAVRRNVSGVYAYEDGSLATFVAAKTLGLKRFYDLPIAYWETGRRLMGEEAERLPGWAPTLGGGLSDSAAKLERKTRELELAGVVVCPSRFVADSLPAWASGKRVVIAPFGSPPAGKEERVPARSGRPMRVLFAGSMGQRKGLGDLFAAMRLLRRKDVELVVMGTPMASMDFYRGELPDFTYEHGRPHEQVLALMRTCDALILPSIVEGRALVMQEAMSQGLPIIITANTGGEDLVEEGRTGFLVPIRSPERIAEKIGWLADHRVETAEMGRLAQRKAEACTWANYGDVICTAVADGAAGT